MKLMKLALLGTAALAAVSVSARADDLADLKAQIEALNSRISQLEATPSIPAGYQLLSISEAKAIVVPSLDVDPAYGDTATNIGILPTADVPATTNIQWSGYARAALVYSSIDVDHTVDGFSDDQFDVLARGQLKVVGTTETAVGEVGALIQLRGNFEGHGDPEVIMNEAWGWWKMTPEMTLGGGYTGSLANIGYGYDGACTCYYTDNAPVALNPGDATQMRLSYASGPLSFAIAIEDSDVDAILVPDGEGPTPDLDDDADAVASDDTLGVAGEIKYAGDAFSAEVSAGWWDGDDAPNDRWQIGAGVGFSLGDMFKISAAAGIGEDYFGGNHGNDNSEYWKASILASAQLSDSVRAEVAYGHAEYNAALVSVGGIDILTDDLEVDAVLAGIYYDPVSQLTIGLEAEWQNWDIGHSHEVEDDNFIWESTDAEAFSVDLVTVFRF